MLDARPLVVAQDRADTDGLDGGVGLEDLLEEQVQVLGLVCDVWAGRSVVERLVDGCAADGPAVQWELHGLGNEGDAVLANRLVQIGIQLVCAGIGGKNLAARRRTSAILGRQSSQCDKPVTLSNGMASIEARVFPPAEQSHDVHSGRPEKRMESKKKACKEGRCI
jgi:hypothetical protein